MAFLNENWSLLSDRFFLTSPTGFWLAFEFEFEFEFELAFEFEFAWAKEVDELLECFNVKRAGGNCCCCWWW